MNPLNPKKLLLTKWTAVKPLAKQKPFLVSRVIQPELPTDPVESVEIEAFFKSHADHRVTRLFPEFLQKIPNRIPGYCFESSCMTLSRQD